MNSADRHDFENLAYLSGKFARSYASFGRLNSDICLNLSLNLSEFDDQAA
ncbi:MAG: hypothetical protein ACTTJC_04765 [Campylobacter sp.]